ncbi:MAG: DUF2155 domain-containing protein [Mariprofundaceae bacterium]|nr:DUF2155 domain-containing protein [Mariprofundaceae bacterium]
MFEKKTSAYKLIPIALVSSLLLFSACEREKSREIEWQLPLSVPDDPHASSKGNQLPGWAVNTVGTAKLVFLKKSTARMFAVAIDNGSETNQDIWRVELQGLAFGLRLKGRTFIDDTNISNPAAFVRLFQEETLMYEGWLYRDFPELFGMDNSDWKVWLEEVTVPPSSLEDDNMLP